MTAAQRIRHTLEGKVQIPGLEKYYIDLYGSVFTEMYSSSNKIRIHKMKTYRDTFRGIDYVMLKKGKGEKHTSFTIKELIEMAYPGKVKKQPETVIKYTSGEGRKPLDRSRVIKHLLRFNPDVQIPLTPNKFGIYETSDGMKRLAILACPECGNLQPDHFHECKQCGEWLLKPHNA